MASWRRLQVKLPSPMRQSKVLGHLVAAQHLAHFQPDLRRREQLLFPPRHVLGDLRQTLLGRLQQGLPLAGALLFQQRVMADDEPLTRIVGGGDFGQILLVQQGELQSPFLDQFESPRSSRR